MQKRKKAVRSCGGITQALLHAAAGIASGAAVAAVLFSAMAALCCKIDCAPQLFAPVSTVLICLSLLAAGLVVSYLHGEKGLLCGLLLGLFCFAVLWIVALMQGQKEFTVLAAIKGAALLASGSMGGCLGAVAKDKKRRIH